MNRREKYLLGIIIVLSLGYLYSASFKTEGPELTLDEKPNSESRIEGIYLKPVPKTVIFAGEPMDLGEPDLSERFDREIIVNTNFHSSTIILIKKSNRWIPQMMPVLKENNIPEDFIYIPIVESGLANVRSAKGAVGFWQLLSETARELGLEVNAEVDERYHQVKSTEAASKYILKAKDKFGTWTNAAASYNIGMRGLARRMESQQVDNYKDLLLNEETSRYIFRILALKMILAKPADYGFDIPLESLYEVELTEDIKVNETIPDLTAFAFSNGINYKILKRHNPWLRKNTLTIKKKGSEYTIKIPVKHPKIIKSDIHITDSSMIGGDRIEEEDW